MTASPHLAGRDFSIRHQLLFTALVLAVVFSVQFPLPMVESSSASLNLSDGIILTILLVFLFERASSGEWDLEFPLPDVTAIYILASVWIIISVAVAVVREPVSVVANALWMLKWLEILIVFILAQQYREEIDWVVLLLTLIGAASIIAIGTIEHTATTSGWSRPRFFWSNPNPLAVFLALPSLLCLIFGALRIRRNVRLATISLAAGLMFALGVVATGSRSGLLTLVTGVAVATVLSRHRISTSGLAVATGLGVVLGFGVLRITGRALLLEKFFPDVAIENGMIVFSGTATGGIYTRFDLFLEAVDLWREQPIFGYGWLSSPENPRVGYLDVLYSQLLVDVGVIGFVLVLSLYLFVFRAFISRRNVSSPAVCSAGAGWVVGMLAAGIGGAYARVPRIMILLFLLLAAAQHLDRR